MSTIICLAKICKGAKGYRKKAFRVWLSDKNAIDACLKRVKIKNAERVPLSRGAVNEA